MLLPLTEVDIKVAVLTQVEGRHAACIGQASNARLLCGLVKITLTFVGMEAVERAAAGQEVEVAIVVRIKKECGLAEIAAGYSPCRCGLLEAAAAVVEKELVGVNQIGDKEVEVAVVVDVAPAGAGGAGEGVDAGDPRLLSAFPEKGDVAGTGCAFVAEEEVGQAVARDEEIGIAVVIDIAEGGTAAAAADEQSGLAGDIAEDAGTVVEIEPVGRILVGEIEINGPIAVGVGPDGGTGACQAVVDAGEFRFLTVAAAADLAVEEIMAVEGGDEDILIAVIVDVGRRSTLVIVDDSGRQDGHTGQACGCGTLGLHLAALEQVEQIEMIGGPCRHGKNIFRVIPVEISDRQAVFGHVPAAGKMGCLKKSGRVALQGQTDDQAAFVAGEGEKGDGLPDMAAILFLLFGEMRDPAPAGNCCRASEVSGGEGPAAMAEEQALGGKRGLEQQGVHDSRRPLQPVEARQDPDGPMAGAMVDGGYSSQQLQQPGRIARRPAPCPAIIG
ncbi:MAG: hypothetical protein BWY77_01280 [bacterium ADurb.Bin431]|nr:MAG: hypothetical protein BWY77_01280 [bacterium ADurb.Bin431]